MPNLAKAKVFSVLDPKQGYHQIELDDESSYLTTFWSPGRLRWLWMPFGIKPASEECQRKQEEILEGLRGVETIHDDILVLGYGETRQEALENYDENLEILLKQCREKNLKLNKAKAKFRMTKVKFMKQILTADGLKPDESKVTAIRNIQTPKNVAEIQRFLGCVNYLTRFLPKVSDTAKPLRHLKCEKNQWQWTEKEQKSFDETKRLLTVQPIFSYYDVKKSVTIQCDASNYGTGGVLLQEGKPIAFTSRVITSSEQNYAVIEKEWLAICHATEKFHHYIIGKDTHAETDHKPIEIIFQKSLLNAPKKLQRMLLKLQRYNLKVSYKRGKEMYIADLLSRIFNNDSLNSTDSNVEHFHIFYQDY